MKQFVFVLRDGQVAQWRLRRGRLARATLNGFLWNDFDDAYWENWNSANQTDDDSEGYDVIFLSDSASGFGKLPKSLLPKNRLEESKWTVADLTKLLSDSSFLNADSEAKNAGVILVQQREKVPLGNGQTTNKLVEMFVDSTLKFVLTKSVTKPVSVESRAMSVAADCFVDEKSRKIKKGDCLDLTVVAVSRLRDACFFSTPSALDEVRIRYSDFQKSNPKLLQSLKAGGHLRVSVEDIRIDAKKLNLKVGLQ